MSRDERVRGEGRLPEACLGFSIRSMAFWSFLATQFLGAFNDNYFKQMVLLICVSDLATGDATGLPYKEIAMAAFALPFVLFSGLGGFLSDRHSKQRVIAGCKLAEIGIVGIGLLILRIPGISVQMQLFSLIAVLALMGTHSAIFSPSKYGVLPELFREDQLLPVNGAVQMTTFLAIIFGTVCAGIALDVIRESLWLGSLVAIAIAVVGALSSFFIPRTRVAEPGLTLKWENLALPKSILGILRQDRDLVMALLVYSLFWFLGGVTQMSVNTVGEGTLKLSSTRTSILVAGLGLGIALGCVIAGFLGKGSGGHRWTMRGSWLLVVTLSGIAFLSSGVWGMPASSGIQGEAILSCLLTADWLEWALRLNMVALGIASGVFVVPVQVFLQQAPPAELKGRLLGVQNLMTWIGILLCAAYSAVLGMLLKVIGGGDADIRWQWGMFLTLALMMLPVSVFYRLPAAGGRGQIADV